MRTPCSERTDKGQGARGKGALTAYLFPLPRTASRCFTLIELLAAIAIMGVLMVILFSVVNQVNKAWTQGEARVETFTEARAALDFMAKELTQAIVRTNVSLLGNTDSLAFIAPVGDPATHRTDLVEIVYRVAGAVPTNLVRRAAALNSPFGAWDVYDGLNWPETFDANMTGVLADNIVFLEFRFIDLTKTGATNYWNSTSAAGPWANELGGLPAPTAYMTHRAPSAIRITLGAVDSRNGALLKTLPAGSSAWTNVWLASAKYFTTMVAVPNGQ